MPHPQIEVLLILDIFRGVQWSNMSMMQLLFRICMIIQFRLRLGLVLWKRFEFIDDQLFEYLVTLWHAPFIHFQPP